MADQKIRVDILGNAKGLNRSLKTASRSLKTFGDQTKAIGNALKTRVTLPLALAGGAAIKSAVDFQKSMTQIKTLVGIAGDEVDKMGLSVRKMAADTGISSKAAADALFFITSAGLRGADALSVLEQATKASAIGLGETAVVADLATSALNAYGVENLNAEQATDILTGAVREGKLSADSLAMSMGKVLPFASQLGIQFNEVGAAFAAMSRTGTDAATASTQIKGIMTALLNPTKQAENQLEQLGLTSAGLRMQLREEGLLSTLQTLTDSFGDNEEAAGNVFGNVRALAGVLDLMGSNLESTRKIFANMNQTAGITSKAFSTLEKDSAFKLEKSLNNLKSTFTTVGASLLDVFLPVIQSLSNFILNAVSAFKQLSPEVQTFSIIMAGVAAALPFVISTIGTLITVLGTLLSPIGLVVAGLAGIAYVIYKNWDEVLPVIVKIQNKFVDLFNSSKTLRIAIFAIRSAFKSAFIFAKAQIDQVVNAFSTMGKLIKEFVTKGIKGSFSNIIEEGFNNAKIIAANAADDIAQTFTDGYEDALSANLEYATVEGVNAGLSNAADKIKSKVSEFTSLFGAVGGGGADTAPAPSGVGGGTTAAPKGTYSHGFLANSVSKEAEAVSMAFDGLENALVDGFGGAIEGLVSGSANMGQAFGGLMEMLGDVAIQIGKAALQIGIGMQAIKMSFSNPATAIAAGIALIAMGSFIKSFGAQFSGGSGGGIPALANGGIVSAPTLAMVGDNRGAGRGNPEVIAPLNKLEGMLKGSQTVNVGGELRVQGQDLVVALQRANRNRDRLL